MVKLIQSLEHWIAVNHPDKLITIMFGHVEDFTLEMQHAYLEWVQTEEGMQYLKGGSMYMEGKNNAK